VAPVTAAQASAGNGSVNFNIGVLNFIGNLNAALSLAQTDSLVRVISSPRIVTMNKEKAEISQKGESIYINQVKDNTTQTITSQPVKNPVELRLTVTPQITNEGSVVLEVDLLRQFVGAVADPSSGAAPINSRTAKTKVLVPNGQTAVIGGIYQSDETDTEIGIPFLKSLPIVGWLFKFKDNERQKNELLLFLTPRILNAKDQTASATPPTPDAIKQ
jgi:type IV pilus assembly protein PilQ